MRDDMPRPICTDSEDYNFPYDDSYEPTPRNFYWGVVFGVAFTTASGVIAHVLGVF